MMITSCGTALHHALVALAVEGYRAEVIRMPESSRPDHLARITITGNQPSTPQAMRLLQTLEIRRTDRRPLSDAPLPDGVVDVLRSAATANGIGLDLLDRDQTIELAGAIDRAQRGQLGDAAGHAELDSWTGGQRMPGTGVPDTNIPDHTPATTVPVRDFGHLGTLGGADTHDPAARYAILYGLDDEPGTWLRAGEALSAVWLEAIAHGVALVPLSAAVESPSTRRDLRQILSGVGYPCIAMRLGVADPQQPTPPRTPRLAVEMTVDTE